MAIYSIIVSTVALVIGFYMVIDKTVLLTVKRFTKELKENNLLLQR